MSFSDWNRDYCPNCKKKNAGGFFTLHFISSGFSWYCPHCGALIRLNYLLMVLFLGFGILITIIVIGILSWLDILKSTLGIIVSIVIISLCAIIPNYITPRVVIRKANEI